jgi:acyl-coenzyme A synthetase/AMP-(fatty) acid ligase/thioesterase domain-containing protein
VIDRLVAVAAAAPDVLAVRDTTTALTFAELMRAAAAVTERVWALNPERHPVAVLRGHGVGAVGAAVGVIASGAPLVVLDPTTPAARLRHYVEAAGATVCVTEPERAAVAAEVCPTVVDVLPEGPSTLSDASTVLLATATVPTDPVLIVYTSGSTGRPKGVACDSRSVLHDAWTNGVGTDCYGPGDVVANLLPMAFSAGVGLSLAGLLLGATQEFFDPRTRPVAQLPGWLADVGATVLVASPAILRGIVASMPGGARLHGLRMLTMAGETVHGAELEAIRTVVGAACEIRNRYGSTETWLIAQYRLRPGDPGPTGATPVGWPVPGVRVQVRSEDGRLSDTGTGRLVVSSRWLSSGYWGEPAATAEVFGTADDGTVTYLTSDTASIGEDGCVRLLGRSDHSVKIGGHLVEPGEIDAVLFAQPEVREAVVVGAESPETGRMRLVAYVVPASGRLQAASVRRTVREVLPSYMVPQDVVLLTELPRTERGKLDRSALPEVSRSVGGVPPRTDWERVVAGLFARVLEVPEIGIHDDFFVLGGDSLSAESLLAAVGDELGVDQKVLSTALLIEAPTVATFAAALRRRRRSEHPTLLPLRTSGGRRPLFCVAGAGGVALGFRALAQRLGPDQPVYALQANGLENRALPDWSVQATARRHVRTLRSVQPRGPYRLAGHSLGAVIAFEMAHQLTAAGDEVELLVVLDSFPPDPALNPPAIEGPLATRVKIAVSLAATGFLPNRGLGHYLRFHRQGMALGRRYRGTPWGGRTLVFVAVDDEAAGRRSLWAGHLNGPWSMQRVSGDHTAILYDPHIADVAAAVAAELDAVDHPDLAVPLPRSAT